MTKMAIKLFFQPSLSTNHQINIAFPKTSNVNSSISMNITHQPSSFTGNHQPNHPNLIITNLTQPAIIPVPINMSKVAIKLSFKPKLNTNHELIITFPKISNSTSVNLPKTSNNNSIVLRSHAPSSSSSNFNGTGLALGITLGVAALIILGYFLFQYYQRNYANRSE